MSKLNIDILGIHELKWRGMGEFNSDDHYIYYCGQESLRRNGVALIVNKILKCSTWVQPQKWHDFCTFPEQATQHHSNPTLCPNHWCQRSWYGLVLWRSTTPSRTNTRKRCPFYHRGLECKSRKSRNTQNNKQVWPLSTKWNRAKANREHADHSKHPFPTT